MCVVTCVRRALPSVLGTYSQGCGPEYGSLFAPPPSRLRTRRPCSPADRARWRCTRRPCRAGPGCVVRCLCLIFELPNRPDCTALAQGTGAEQGAGQGMGQGAESGAGLWDLPVWHRPRGPGPGRLRCSPRGWSLPCSAFVVAWTESCRRCCLCGTGLRPRPERCRPRLWSSVRRTVRSLVESGAGAPTLGSGGDSGAFVPGLSPAPIVTFPAPALRTRRADFRHRALQWDHAPRTRTARAIWACRWSPDAARLPLCIPTPSPARRRACSRLDNIEPVRFDSLTYACDASGIIALIAGSRHRHSRRPSSFRHRSTPEVPFLDRHYPASSVVRTSPPPRPAQPAPHGVPVGACHTTDRASRVAPIPLFHACRRQYPGGTSRCACRSLPGQWQPSPTYRRVGSRIPGFEACSAFYGLFPVMRCTSPIPLWNRGQAAFPQRITVTDQVA